MSQTATKVVVCRLGVWKGSCLPLDRSEPFYPYDSLTKGSLWGSKHCRLLSAWRPVANVGYQEVHSELRRDGSLYSYVYEIGKGKIA